MHKILHVDKPNEDLAKWEKLFQEFWDSYPTDDSHGVHEATRVIREGRTRCRRKFFMLLEEGVDGNMMIEAVSRDVEMRKSSSDYKSNHMRYMKTPYNWLTNRVYESIPLDTKKKQSKQTNYGKDMV